MKENIFKAYLNIFLTMAKIGLFTFGGGYAMISLIEAEIVEKKGWITKDEFINLIAIAESTPGPIAINMATYIGLKKAGIIGAIIATLSVSLPSFVIIYIISLFIEEFLNLKYANYAFKGIQACVTLLILNAGIKLFKQMDKNVFNILLFSITIICIILFSILNVTFSVIYYILICGLLGLFVYLVKYFKDKKVTNNA